MSDLSSRRTRCTAPERTAAAAEAEAEAEAEAAGAAEAAAAAAAPEPRSWVPPSKLCTGTATRIRTRKSTVLMSSTLKKR